MEYSHQEDTFGNLPVEPLAKNCLLKMSNAGYSIVVDELDSNTHFSFRYIQLSVLLLLQNVTNQLETDTVPE